MADNCRMYLGPQTMIEGVLLPIAGSEELGPAAGMALFKRVDELFAYWARCQQGFGDA